MSISSIYNLSVLGNNIEFSLTIEEFPAQSNVCMSQPVIVTLSESEKLINTIISGIKGKL